MPTIKFAPAIFRREVERRLLDVRGVQEIVDTNHRQTVWWMVEKGKLPPPILRLNRAYALWDKDEIESFLADGKK